MSFFSFSSIYKGDMSWQKRLENNRSYIVKSAGALKKDIWFFPKSASYITGPQPTPLPPQPQQ